MTHRRRRAFTVTHVLFALALLAAFSVAAIRVFRLSVLTTEGVARGQERLFRIEQALHVMRADVWQAHAIEPAEPARLRLNAADGSVEWRTEQEGDLTRTAGKDVRKWTGLNLAFERAGSAVLLKDKTEVVAVLERGGGK